jgi:hypothetical protein
MLEHHRHVERFAYMNSFSAEPGALFEGKGDAKKPTKLGELYREIGR